MECCRRATPGTPLLFLAFLLLSSRTTRSEEDRDSLWDAWGSWSECSRTCGGGASYSLRRCLSSKSCEGRNIRYRTCSNVDCPPEAGDFRAQQCSAHNDVKHHGEFYEWLPVSNDPDNPCALKCQAKGTDLVVELAPKVLDGTRCYTDTLDMCINGLCQERSSRSFHHCQDFSDSAKCSWFSCTHKPGDGKGGQVHHHRPSSSPVQSPRSAANLSSDLGNGWPVKNHPAHSSVRALWLL